MAEREWQAAWRQVNLGETLPDQLTVNDAFVRYYTEVCKGTAYGERTQRYNLRVMLLALGRTTLLSDLSDRTVNGAVQWLRTRQPTRTGQSAKLSPSTINRYLTTLSVVCKRARELWGVQVGPWAKARHVLAEPEGREVFLGQEDARRLISCAPGHLRPILLLSLMTGLRRENLIRLAWETVSLDLARAILIQKGGRRLTLSLPPPAVELLKQIQPEPEARVGAVFRFGDPHTPCACPRCANKSGRYAGKPIRSVKRAFATACKAAKLPEAVRFHDLRHTYASWLLAECGDLRIVQEALGHKQVTTTARYAHLLPGRKETAIAGVANKLTDATSSHTGGHNAKVKAAK